MCATNDQPLRRRGTQSDDSELAHEIDIYLMDCQSRSLSPNTIRIYTLELRLFREYLEERELTDVTDIAPRHIRSYLILLGEGRKPAGVHMAYRVIKTFLRWYEAEVDPELFLSSEKGFFRNFRETVVSGGASVVGSCAIDADHAQA